MLRSFVRLFVVLIVVEAVTIITTMLLLDHGIRHWTESKARELEGVAPRVAAEFAPADMVGLKSGGIASPQYQACLRKLALLEKKYYPYGGCTFALFDVREGARGPWLLMLAGESPPYNVPMDVKEPDGQVSPEVRRAAEGQVTSTAVPYGGFGYDSELSAYAPIRSADGKMQGVVAVDYDVSSLNDLREVVKTAFVWAVLPATLLSAVLAFLLASRFVEPMELIGQVYDRLRKRHVGAQPVLIPVSVAVVSAMSGPLQVETVKPEGLIAEPHVSVASVTERAERLVGEQVPVGAGEDADPRWKTLTAREREVLLYVGQGMTNKRIAEVLFVSQETIKRHLKNLFPKLGVSNRTEAALYAISHGAMSWESNRDPGN